MRISRPWLLLLLIAVAGTLAFAVSVRLYGHERFPVADEALTELYTLRALHGELTTGAYSRFGWNHPGPLFFYLSVPLYVVSGYRFAALEITALFLNLACLVTIGWILRREASGSAGLAVVAVLGCYAVRFSALATSSWNPHVALFPFALLLIAAAAFAAGRVSLLPIIGAAWSLAVQSHIAFALPATAAVAAAWLFLIVVTRRGRANAAPLRSPVAASLGLLAVLWFPPGLDALKSGSENNLTRLTTFFSSAGGSTHSLGESASLLSHELTAVLQPSFANTETWIHSVSRETRSTRFWERIGAAELILLALGSVAGIVRKRLFPAAICAVSFVTSLAAIVAIAQVRGPIDHYLVAWCGVLGAVVTGVAVESLLDATLKVEWTAALQHTIPAAAALLTMTVMVIGCMHIVANDERAEERSSVARLSDISVDYLSRHNDARPLIGIRQPVWPIAAGLVLQLYKDGRLVSVDRDWVSMFGPPFSAVGGETTVLVAEHELPNLMLLGATGDVRLYLADEATAK